MQLSHQLKLILCCFSLTLITGCASSNALTTPSLVRVAFRSDEGTSGTEAEAKVSETTAETTLVSSPNVKQIEPEAFFAPERDENASNSCSATEFDVEPFSVDESFEGSLFERAWQDQCEFYSGDSLQIMMFGFVGGAIAANSSVDEAIRHKFQQNIRSASSDEWFELLHAQKELGNGYFTLPLFAASWMIGACFDEDPRAVRMGIWGERSLRAFAVGAPPMLLAQRLTGASRPGETDDGSHWNPLQDDNGVSGHSFMGAVPFLTAARMTDDPWLKAFYYTGSTLAPLSRVNDDHHYASQAFLGWGFAWLATRAVSNTDDRFDNWLISPIAFDDKQGLAVEFTW